MTQTRKVLLPLASFLVHAAVHADGLRRPNLDEVLQQLSTLLKDKQDLLKAWVTSCQTD